MPLGFTARFFSEIDPDACEVLSEHYPETPNLGDLSAIDHVPGHCDVIIGGTPCQSFSIQGLRKGINDDRGNLARHFVRLVDQHRPSWVVWENVPGVMSTNGGRDFGTILGALASVGYQWSYRIMDARFFGVAQRRRRVYVVAHRRWQSAAAVLFEPLPGSATNHATKKVQETGSRRIDSGPRSSEGILGWTGDETPKFGREIVPTLRASQGGEGVGIINHRARRLLPVEWERLQGFPDHYTNVGISDRQRTRLLGNAFCVPVIRWIGERILLCHEVNCENGF